MLFIHVTNESTEAFPASWDEWFRENLALVNASKKFGQLGFLTVNQSAELDRSYRPKRVLYYPEIAHIKRFPDTEMDEFDERDANFWDAVPLTPRQQIDSAGEWCQDGNVIVTTSEHILLWVLLAVRKEAIPLEKLLVFLHRKDKVIPIQVDEYGDVYPNWEGGFFHEREELLFDAESPAHKTLDDYSFSSKEVVEDKR